MQKVPCPKLGVERTEMGGGLCCYGKGKVLSTLGTGVSLETPLCAVPVGERTERLAFYEDSM